MGAMRGGLARLHACRVFPDHERIRAVRRGSCPDRCRAWSRRHAKTPPHAPAMGIAECRRCRSRRARLGSGRRQPPRTEDAARTA
jgi:hypothetical protein